MLSSTRSLLLPAPLVSVAAPALSDDACPRASDALHFEGFSILPGQRRLLVGGEPAKLGARAFDLLMALVGNRDRVVSKDELLDGVWAGLVVEESNLPVHVSQLRKLCGAGAIATVPGRGYQFTAPSVGAPLSPSALPPRTPRHEGSERQPSAPAPGGNLPAAAAPLIGRDAEQAELTQQLSEERWVTVTGAGGMGKTRLAEAVGMAQSASAVVWWVELASVSDAQFVPNAVAQTLGATLVDAEHVLESLLAVLHGGPALLVLDNCEHLTDAVGDLCVALLARLPLLRVLVTSQELLRRQGESVFKLGPLSLPEGNGLDAVLASGAVSLLSARVRAQWRQFALTPDNMADAVALCRQVDGLPLAIELVAGRVPLLGLAGVRARMGEMLRLLTGDARVRLRRHQTLRAALDWSYQLLTPTEQRLLRCLGSFAGSFSLQGVRLIGAEARPDPAPDPPLDHPPQRRTPGEDTADDWQVLDTLASLIDKSLVQLRGQDQPRYGLLETTRSYAMEQLAAAGETEDVLARHARTTRDVCTLATRHRDTEAIWHEIANVRAAFGWAMRHGEPRLAVALAIDSSVVFALGGLVGEVLERLVAVEPFVDDSLPLPQAAQYWQWLGRFGNDGRLPASRCIHALETAEKLFRQLRNHRHVHACLRMRAEALLDQGDMHAAAQAIDLARQLETQGHPLADRMRRLRIEGMILDARGQHPAAVKVLEQALALARLADIHRYVATLTQDIGQSLLNQGDAVAAEQRFLAVLDDRRHDVSVALAGAYARIGLATALLMQGQLARARLAALEAIPPLRSCGILLAQTECLAWLLAALGQLPAAQDLLHTADAFRRFSQTARSPTDLRAYSAARALLLPSGRAVTAAELPEAGSDTLADAGVDAETEVAQIVMRALIDAPCRSDRPSNPGQACLGAVMVAAAEKRPDALRP